MDFKTLITPFTGLTTDTIYGIEKELKAGNAVRVACEYNDKFVPDVLILERRQKTVNEYLRHMQYIYGEELMPVLNEEDGNEYLHLAYWNTIFPHKYLITFTTMEGGKRYCHCMSGLLTAKNKTHARDRFRVYWNAKESSRRPHPRHAFNISIERED